MSVAGTNSYRITGSWALLFGSLSAGASVMIEADGGPIQIAIGTSVPAAGTPGMTIYPGSPIPLFGGQAFPSTQNLHAYAPVGAKCVTAVVTTSA